MTLSRPRGRRRLPSRGVSASPSHGLFLAPFNELSEPSVVVELARTAEESGFDGVFLWDHVLRRPEESPRVADPWIVLAAVATATSRVRLGPMVTPLARRRPQVVAREIVTLDRLSGGRAVLGLGLGVDTTGELSRFGEVVDPVTRGDLLDEGAALVASLMSGEAVEHRGRFFLADGVRFLPTPLQQPRVPIWLGAHANLKGSRALRRAARYEGVFLIDADEAALERALALIETTRGSLEGFDLAILADAGVSPAAADRLGVTWMMHELPPSLELAEARRRAAEGPPG